MSKCVDCGQQIFSKKKRCPACAEIFKKDKELHKKKNIKKSQQSGQISSQQEYEQYKKEHHCPRLSYGYWRAIKDGLIKDTQVSKIPHK